MGVDGRFISFLWFVEAEPVAPTVSGAVKLLQQEDHRLMDDSQHPQSVHTWVEKRKHSESSVLPIQKIKIKNMKLILKIQ